MAQSELPRRVVDRAPRQREARRQLLVFVLQDKRIEEVPGDLLIGPVRPGKRIESGWLDRNRDPKVLGLSRLAQAQRRREDESPQ